MEHVQRRRASTSGDGRYGEHMYHGMCGVHANQKETPAHSKNSMTPTYLRRGRRGPPGTPCSTAPEELGRRMNSAERPSQLAVRMQTQSATTKMTSASRRPAYQGTARAGVPQPEESSWPKGGHAGCPFPPDGRGSCWAPGSRTGSAEQDGPPGSGRLAEGALRCLCTSSCCSLARWQQQSTARRCAPFVGRADVTISHHRTLAKSQSTK